MSTAETLAGSQVLDDARRLASGRTPKVCLALLLLFALYWHADWRAVAAAVANLQSAPLALALLLFVPQTLVSACRWKWLVARVAGISLAEAARHTLAASAWNLITPSKLGDFSKAAMLGLPSGSRRRAAGLVLIEKGCDVAALCLLWAVGFLCQTSEQGLLPIVTVLFAMMLIAAALKMHMSRDRLAAGAASLVLWTLHLWQIDLFLKAAGVDVAWHVAAARIPAAIFAGLLPLSFCGLGTRDAALVWLFADTASASTMAAVGLLTATRYLIPGAAGIPWALQITSSARRA